MTMPEEVNRRVTDILSDLLFVDEPGGRSTTSRARASPPSAIHFVGNPMIDTLLANLDRFDVAAARAAYGLDGPYAVATLHRPANVDTPDAAARLVAMLERSWRASCRSSCRSIRAAPRRWPRPGCADGAALRSIEPLGLRRVPVARPRRRARRDRLRRDPGGDDDPRRAVPDGPPEHRATDHDQPRHEPARRARAVGPDVAAEVLRRAAGAAREAPPLWDGHAGERIAAILRGRVAGTQRPA